MEYILIGQDGKEYGPYGLEMLRQWRDDGSLLRQTKLKHPMTNQVVEAGTLPELFDPVAAPPGAAPYFSQPQTAYPRATDTSDEGPGVLIGIILRAAGALLLFFVFKGLGLIVAGYGLYYAIQAKQEGSKWGTAALVIGGIAFAIVAIGWIVRLTTRSA